MHDAATYRVATLKDLCRNGWCPSRECFFKVDALIYIQLYPNYIVNCSFFFKPTKELAHILWDTSHAHTIHAWYMFLHLVDFYGKYR